MENSNSLIEGCNPVPEEKQLKKRRSEESTNFSNHIKNCVKKTTIIRTFDPSSLSPKPVIIVVYGYLGCYLVLLPIAIFEIF